MSASLLSGEPTWREQAACQGHRAVFFPSPSQADVIDRAIAICEGCPVKTECADELETVPVSWRFGVWAGDYYNPQFNGGIAKRRRLTCEWCGTEFVHFGSGAPPKSCGEDCRRELKRYRDAISQRRHRARMAS